MPKRSRKPPVADVNQIAARIIEQLSRGESTLRPEDILPLPAGRIPLLDGKNPAAVALGRLGGLKGGKARAKSLSAMKRAEIAKMAAKARWKRRRP